jgi:hypothetical protein
MQVPTPQDVPVPPNFLVEIRQIQQSRGMTAIDYRVAAASPHWQQFRIHNEDRTAAVSELVASLEADYMKMFHGTAKVRVAFTEQPGKEQRNLFDLDSRKVYAEEYDSSNPSNSYNPYTHESDTFPSSPPSLYDDEGQPILSTADWLPLPEVRPLPDGIPWPPRILSGLGIRERIETLLLEFEVRQMNKEYTFENRTIHEPRYHLLQRWPDGTATLVGRYKSVHGCYQRVGNQAALRQWETCILDNGALRVRQIVNCRVEVFEFGAWDDEALFAMATAVADPEQEVYPDFGVLPGQEAPPRDE